MPGGMKVDYATIHQAADDCNRTGGELEALFEQLKSQLAPLVGTWEGNAMEAWDAKQQQWNAALEEMKQLLAQIATALPQIADGYQETDTAIKGMF